MKTFTVDVIPKIKRFSKTLDDHSIFINHHWVLLNEMANTKTVYIFREHKELLVSENGLVTKGTWEYLGHNSILFETNKHTLLLKHGFVDEHIMALRIDGLEGFLFLINETRYGIEMNKIGDVLKFLEHKYLDNNSLATLFNLNREGMPSYTESYPVKAFDFSYGRHDKIYVTFADGISGRIFRGYSTNEYFFNHATLGRKYCLDKEHCINKLYNYKKYKD